MLKNLIQQAFLKNEQPNQQIRTIIIKKQHLQIEESNTVNMTTEPKRPKFRIHPRSKSQQKSQGKPASVREKVYYSARDRQTPAKTPRWRSLGNKRLSSEKKSAQKVEKTVQKHFDRREKGDNKAFRSYLEYIHGSDSDEYKVNIDFGYLRRRGKRGGITNSQKRNIRILEGIFQCLYQKLSGTLSETSKQIQENCHLYLVQPNKPQVQILFSNKYPPIILSKLRAYLVYQRLVIYTLFVLSKNHSLQKMGSPQIESLKIIIKYTYECIQALTQPLIHIQQEVVNKIGETFMVLKAVGQMEKKLSVVVREMQRVYIRSNKVLVSIEDSLMELLTGKAQYTLERLSMKQMELSWKYFKIPPVPYLPSKSLKPYTLVVQLTKTLIFYEKSTKTLKYRPYVDIFITKLMGFFEIVLFSSLSYEYTKVIVQQIEKVGRYFDYCLCQAHMISRSGKLVKDYGRLGRDEEKVVIVDFQEPMDRKWTNNFFQLPVWQGDKADRSLYMLTNTLYEAVVGGCEDIRQYLRKQKAQMSMIVQQLHLEQVQG